MLLQRAVAEVTTKACATPAAATSATTGAAGAGAAGPRSRSHPLGNLKFASSSNKRAATTSW